MSINMQQNYYELFQLPVQFDIDMRQIASRFRELQTVYHPDKFVNGTDNERFESVKVTTFINEARDTLLDSRLRARYLLGLKGIDFNDEIDTSKDPTYLMQQMELRESIEDAEHAEDPFEELDSLRRIVKQRQLEVEDDFKNSYEGGQFDEAKQAALKLRFCERIISEIKRIEERVDEDDDL